MGHTVDTNALLLQVMAHDLLAPLTAIKWQVELLGRKGLSDTKRKEYMAQIQESTTLGITLTKHAHVAGKVLVGSYDATVDTHRFSDIVQASAVALLPQYERHGLSLDIGVDDEAEDRLCDKELVGLFIWSIAKFFLSCVFIHETVTIRGSAPQVVGGVYTISYVAVTVSDRDEHLRLFAEQKARNAFDQAYIFAVLIHKIADRIGADVAVLPEGESGMCIDVSYRGTVTEDAA